MKKGFTLIELLVVVAIIGLLASIVVVSLGGARKGGRDALAITDLKQIQTAMELYYDSQMPNVYPEIPGNFRGISSSGSATGRAALAPYLNPVPTGTGAVDYHWCTNSGPASEYWLKVDLETDKAGSLSGDCYYLTRRAVLAGDCQPGTLNQCILP